MNCGGERERERERDCRPFPSGEGGGWEGRGEILSFLKNLDFGVELEASTSSGRAGAMVETIGHATGHTNRGRGL